MATKKSNRGGYRPGAGAKKTGINVFRVTFAIHKDDIALIKEMVYSKLKELKAARDGVPLPKDFVPFKHKIAFIKKEAAEGNGKKTETCAEAAEKCIKEKSKFKPQPFTSAYLQSRRSKKLGLK